MLIRLDVLLDKAGGKGSWGPGAGRQPEGSPGPGAGGKPVPAAGEGRPPLAVISCIEPLV